MIAILGDIHFSSYKPWNIQVCDEFLKWFKSWEFNKKGNSLILAGDLVQSHINGGKVIDYLERLITDSNFDSIHICVGNHDKKKVDGKEELAYEFYKQKPNVFVYEEAQEVFIENLRVLFLPYFTGVNKEGLTMKAFYSNLYRNESFKGKWDLVVGHFAGEDNSFPGANDCIENLDKLNADKICLGHIHTRFVNPERYIGSVFAGKRNENDFTRAAWIYNGKDWKEQKLPIFNEFTTVVFPNELPKARSKVPIYTILNCASEQVAREKYGDINIRRVTTSNNDFANYDKYEQSRNFTSIKNINILDLFDDFSKNQTPPLEKSVIDICKNMIKAKKKS